MAIKEERNTSRDTKRVLDNVRSDWLTTEIAKGLEEIKRGEVREIEIDPDKGEYRVVQAQANS